MSHTSHKEWSWLLIIGFFTLSIFNIWFGLAGLICMAAPLIHALKGNGKKHCTHYCPRGSFLSRILSKFSLRKKMPRFMTTKSFRNILLILMFTMLAVSLSLTKGNFKEIAFVVFRFMFASFGVSTLLGMIFKPKTWCAICPMGHATVLISNQQKKQKLSKPVTENEM